ncbi:arsenate reductase family protein [Helicobacter enhydrae]|nr:Spx/MgsR family RNA polymerase-binding regulatory protein [Helicobacter enhydrae]
MKVWGIKNCQSVKKALEVLERKNIAYVFIDYKKNPPSAAQIGQWVQQVGIDIVLNVKGKTYRDLQLKDKNLSLDAKIAMMCEYPTLIKRPILEKDEEVYFGFDEQKYEEIL